MTKEYTPAQKQAIIDEEVARITKEIEAVDFSLNLSRNSIVSHGWIVTCGKDITTAYSFDTEPVTENGKRRYQTTNCQWGQPHKVSRWTKEDAHTIAASYANGNGKMQAVHWIDAAEAYREQLQRILGYWTKDVQQAAEA